MICPECAKAKLVAWDGVPASFWDAIENVSQHRDIESDHAVLSEVLELALLNLLHAQTPPAQVHVEVGTEDREPETTSTAQAATDQALGEHD
jgi:hypothetical protein